MKENKKTDDPTKRFVGPNGEFKPTNQPADETTTIEYLEEMLEWLYYHDNISNEKKLYLITSLEEQIQLILSNPGGGSAFSMPIKYNPTWSVKLKKDGL